MLFRTIVNSTKLLFLYLLIQLPSPKIKIPQNSNVNELKTNFQDGVDSVYNAVVAKGSTPASKSLSDIVNGIKALHSVTIIHEPDGTYNEGERDIKAYRDDWADLTIDNFYGLIKYYFCSYGGQQPSATYTWTYDNTTGILKCKLSAGQSAYFKRETDIVIVR